MFNTQEEFIFEDFIFNDSVVAKNFNPNHDKLGQFSSGGGYSGMAPNAFTTAIRKEYSKQATWGPVEKTAISDYTATSFHRINGYLNDIHDNLHPDQTDTEQDVKTLDRAMKNTLKKDTTLYRGFGSSQYLMPGGKIVTQGYNSSTFFEHKGVQFAQTSARGSSTKLAYVLKINAKKGQKGIIPLLEGDGIGIRGVEAEFILPRGITFQIDNIIDKGTYEEVAVNIV